MATSTYLSDAWSATDYGDPELSDYAEVQLRKDTRTGIRLLAGLALVMQICVAAIATVQSANTIYLYTSLLFALLCLHILASASFVKDTRSLHALGMVLLIVGALSITVLAHRSGDLHIGMMAAVVMLFVATPLVPWALRETTTVIGLTYFLLTLSLGSVPGRFAAGSLLILQLLIAGAAVVVFTVTGRNTFIRKHDIRARFELEQAHSALEMLSMQDPLTGAWNRRYLDEAFGKFAEQCLQQNRTVHIAILDIDDFKDINDNFGHQVGDSVLKVVAETFVQGLGDRGQLVRLGGDEFLIVFCGDGLDEIVDSAISEMQTGALVKGLTGTCTVTLSAGFAATEPGRLANLQTLYRNADRALYAEKQQRIPTPVAATSLTHTGKWNL